MKNIFLVSITFALFICTEASDNGDLQFSWKKMQAEKKIEDNMQSTLKNIILAIGTAPPKSKLGTQGKQLGKILNGLNEAFLRVYIGKDLDKTKVMLNAYVTHGSVIVATTEDEMKLFDFLQNFFSLWGNFDEPEIEIIIKTIESKIERRYDRDNNFSKLLESPVVRRSINSALKILREAPLRNCVNTKRKLNSSFQDSNTENELNNNKYCWYHQNVPEKFRSWVNTYFENHQKPLPINYYKVINSLKVYLKLKNKDRKQNKRRKKNNFDVTLLNRAKLEAITKNALKTLFFDQFPKLDAKQRRYIQHLLQTLWKGPQRYVPRVQAVVKAKKKNKKKNRKKISRTHTKRPTYKYRTTPRTSHKRIRYTTKSRGRRTTLKPKSKKRPSKQKSALRKQLNGNSKKIQRKKNKKPILRATTQRTTQKLEIPRSKIRYTTKPIKMLTTKRNKKRNHKINRKHPHGFKKVLQLKKDKEEALTSTWDVTDDNTIEQITERAYTAIYRKNKSWVPSLKLTTTAYIIEEPFATSPKTKKRRKNVSAKKVIIKYSSNLENHDADSSSEIKVIKRKRKLPITAT